MTTRPRHPSTVHTIAAPLARLLWQRHTLYRERGGTVVIRCAYVERWISLTPAGLDLVRIRSGRLLDGGTTAPARAETTASLAAGLTALAAECRVLLAAASAEPAAGVQAPAAEPRMPRPRTRRARLARWLAIGALIAAGLLLALVAAAQQFPALARVLP